MAETIGVDLTSAKNEPARDHSLVWLAKVKTESEGTLRYALGYNNDISYFGQSFTAVAGSIEEIIQEDGTLTEVQIALSNLDREAARLLHNEELQGKRLKLWLVDTKALGTPRHHHEVLFRIMRGTVTNEAAVFVVGSYHLMQHIFPKNRFLPDRCRHTFKDDMCQYVGVISTCDKSYATSTGCLGRDNQDHFGGFPHMLRENDPLLA